MPKTIDDATYEATIRRHWAVPGAHERPPQAPTLSDFPADDYEAALASSEPIPTEPGELEETQRSVDSLGLWIVCGVVGTVCLVSLLARYWPLIVDYGMAR